MTDLAGRTCVPCRGGVPPMEQSEAKRYLCEAPGWALQDDGTRIERTFKHKNFKEAFESDQSITAIEEEYS